MKKLFKNKKGFTLVELMVVVAILGVLIAIAIPVYNSATGSAEKRACETNARTIESAYQIAKADGKTHDNIDTVAELETLGYLKAGTVCPVNGTPYVINADGTVTAHTH